MMNWVEAARLLLHGQVKKAGLQQQTVEVEPLGTTINFWVPKVNKQRQQRRKQKQKPAVILVHGFAADGIMTWYFQVKALAAKYSVYVPDLLFFGASTTQSSKRTPGFHAECLLRALDQLGVDKCTVVGFSYGGFLAFKMAELRPDMVHSFVVSGSALTMTDSTSSTLLNQIGCSSFASFLLPNTVEELKTLFSVGSHKKLPIPDFLYRDFLKVMFNNRKERKELLEGVMATCEDTDTGKQPTFTQRILLLRGEDDSLFTFEHAKDTMKQLGERATLQGIKNAGHLVHLERPCVYSRKLKEFLSLVHARDSSTA